jgi:hypothetical protein
LYMDPVRSFAAAHSKPMAFPEWGCATRSDAHGGGDDPLFVQEMYEFIADPTHNVAFHVYASISVGEVDFRLAPPIANADDPAAPTQMPRAAALFLQLFGGLATN